jgi:lactocepin
MSLRQNRIVLIFIFLYCFCIQITNGYSQNQWIILPDGQRIDLPNSGSYSYSLETEDSKVNLFELEDPSEVVNVIVVFNDPPLAELMNLKSLAKASSTALTLSSLQMAHSQFKADLGKVIQRSSAQNFQCTIKHDYYRALNGIALKCNRGMLGHIRRMPDVKEIYNDGQVQANLTESVAHIRADIVQDSLGFRGDGILVGVLDTGIDYNHEALGGGIGES